MPTPMAKVMAKRANSMVPGKRSRKTSVTGRPYCVELPKSSVIARCRKRRYCTQIGSSSPNSALYCAIASGVARSPSAAWAGPPGSARSQAKRRRESPSRIGISWSSRRTMKRSTCPGQPFATALSWRVLDRDRADGGDPATVGAVLARLLLDRDRGEVLRGQRARDQALDVGRDGERGRRVRDRETRQVVHDQPVGLLVVLGPLRGV